MNFHDKETEKKTGSKKRVNRKPKKIAAVVVAVLVAVFVIFVAVALILLTYKPSYHIDLPFVTTDETGGMGIVVTDAEGNDVEVERNQEQVNFLILGKDRWAFNTDVMIIASYNVTDGAITMMQIPRDTYIDVGRGNLKANSLLASFYNEALRKGEKSPTAAAVKQLEKAIEKVFCITIDYYAMMDLNGFVNIVDALGGVEVNVPFDMKYKDPVQGLNIDIKKGLQTLDGEKAEQFIRFRADYIEGDIGRVDAQKIFISACINKVKSSFNVSTISKIIEEVLEYVKTDIPMQDLIYYAKKALSVDLDKMTMLTLPGIQGRQYNTSGTWYYIAYRDGTISAVNKYFNSYNFEVTADLFDKENALYDTAGTYMHSIYLTKNTKEESYTANKTEDIDIYKYQGSSSKKPKVTTAASVVLDPVSTESIEMPNGGGLIVIPDTDSPEIGVHTTVNGTIDQGDITETTSENANISQEVALTEKPVETAVVTYLEDPVSTPTASEDSVATMAPQESEEE